MPAPAHDVERDGRPDRLLRPRSIAVVGGREAERLIEQLGRIGYAGAVWPVHPGRKHVGGIAAFADVDTLPGAPDAAFVAVNRERSVEVVAALALHTCPFPGNGGGTPDRRRRCRWAAC